MKKRFLALALSLCMMIGSVPLTVFAGDADEDTSVCSCSELCTEDNINSECIVCSEDYANCNGRGTDLAENKNSEDKTDKAKNNSSRNSGAEISDSDSLIDLLNSSKTENEGKNYTLESDITISGSDYSSYTNREFAGTIDGKNHTITIEGEAGPLFDTLRGSVSNLNVEFKDDVNGVPFAVDILNEDDSELLLKNITIEVGGDILPSEHDYTEHYAYVLAPPYNYGNWYINYSGQPVWLATGFAWYLWGASVEDISITVHGNIGTDEEKLQDTTSAGFAYFAVRGNDTDEAVYKNIDITVDGNIQSYAGDPDDGGVSPAYAASYGFAAGTTDKGASFGAQELTEFSRVKITAENIIAESKQGSSYAAGMAYNMQGYTHDCTVDISEEIRAISKEGCSENNQYSYSNGDAYAYGFLFYAVGPDVNSRRDFCDNTVNAGAITARTDAVKYSGKAMASGFGHQMMNSTKATPDLSYNNNSVNIENDIFAKANKGGAVAAGFVTNTGMDELNNEDHIYKNNVYVGGNIRAESMSAAADASGYAYLSSTHRRACTVQVKGDISSSSPTQATAAGFTVFQRTIEYASIKDCSVTVGGDIKAEVTGKGIGIAVGLVGAVMNSRSMNESMEISGNTIKVNGDIWGEGVSGNYIIGLIGGQLKFGTYKPDKLIIENNHFIGKDRIAATGENGQLYTDFTYYIDESVGLELEGNTVEFTDDNGRTYTSDLEYINISSGSPYGSLWQLTKIEEIIKEYTITASAGKNGSISPDGEEIVKEGEDITFTITPDKGYKISDVIVDGESIGAEESYTFTNVKENHTIKAVFEKKSDGGSSSGGSSYSLSSEAYYVRYHDGDDLVKDGKYGEGERVTIKGDVFDAPLGKALAGWSTEEGGKVEFNSR